MVSQLAQMFEEVQKDSDVIHLEIGDLDFSVSFAIDQALRQAIDEGKTHYTSIAGTSELRRLAAQDFQQDGIKTANPENTIIGAGAKPLISLAIRALLADKTKNEFIILDPSYPTYKRAVLNYGGIYRAIDTLARGFYYPFFGEIDKAVFSNTKCVIVNYPNNPTGIVCSLEQLARLPEDVWILFDEAYCRLVYNSTVYLSAAALPQIAKRAIVIRSCSKTYAMSGLRIGYLTAPQEITDKIIDLLSDEFGCPSSISQEAAVAALSNGRITEGLGRLNARKHYLCNWLDNHAISYPKPQGAFYVFADFSSWRMTSEEIAEKLLLEAKVAVTPGTAFGDYDGWIRLSYASVGLNQLEKALNRIEKVLFK